MKIIQISAALLFIPLCNAEEGFKYDIKLGVVGAKATVVEPSYSFQSIDTGSVIVVIPVPGVSPSTDTDLFPKMRISAKASTNKVVSIAIGAYYEYGVNEFSDIDYRTSDIGATIGIRYAVTSNFEIVASTEMGYIDSGYEVAGFNGFGYTVDGSGWAGSVVLSAQGVVGDYIISISERLRRELNTINNTGMEINYDSTQFEALVEVGLRF